MSRLAIEDTSRSQAVSFPALACGSVLLAAGLLGGGRGNLGDTLVQLMAIGLLGLWLQIRRFPLPGVVAPPPWVEALPLLAIAVPLLQLLPLPTAWAILAPARAELNGQLAAVGVALPMRWSLNPWASARALQGLLPAIGIFLVTLHLPVRAQRHLLAVLLVLAASNVLLGMAQLAEGPASGLRWHWPTNVASAVGFFANRNHQANLLVMCLPLVLAWAAWLVADRLAGHPRSLAWAGLAIGLTLLLILGIALSNSRAGLLLGMLAVLAVTPMLLGLRRQQGVRRVLAVVVLIAAVLSVQFALVGIMQRLEADPLEDRRWDHARVTSEAAQAHAPWGSGLGTFRQAHVAFEREPRDVVVNHAHNDYLELWLEGGWLALLALLAFAAAWAWASWQAWRRRGELRRDERAHYLMVRACWIAASLALLHEALDYPLRTTAGSSAFALLLAVVFSGLQAQRVYARESRRLAGSPTDVR
jgi:O-antigen ligase